MSRWSSLRVLLLALFVAASACGDCTDGTAGNNNTNNRTEPETEVPEGSKLKHVADGGMDSCNPLQPICAKNVTYSSSIPLAVQLVDGEDNPIDNTNINFELNAGTATGTTLSSAGAVTDAAGMAETSLRAGTTAGTAEIIVSAGGAESAVDPIKFIVAVNSKGASSYIITFNHRGNAEFKDIKVRAFPVATTCDQVVEDHVRETTPNVNPVLTAVTQTAVNVQAGQPLPQAVIANVPNGTAYTIEARGYHRTQNEVESAFGCKDANPPVENGMSVNVEVDLVDNLPRIAGTYDANHTFSIIGAVCQPDGMGGFTGVLPSGVCLAVDLIGRLATDPGSFLVGDGMGSPGLLQLIVDFLPDGSFKDSINSFLSNGFIQDVAGNVLNDFFQDWINNNAPAWVKNAVNITGDIYESLKEFRVNGTIRIEWEPTPQFDMETGAVVGILSMGGMDGMQMPGKQVWSEVVVYWTGDCPAGNEACRERTFSANDVGTNNVVEGYFTGSLVPMLGPDQKGYGLIIDQHSLTLNYGLFILGVLEKVILPSVFDDQTVTSVEAAIEKLLQFAVGGNTGCEGFGQWIDDTIGGGGAVAEGVCNNLLQRASDGIRDYLSENLTISGEDNFLIGTPDGVPCQLYEPELYAGEWNGKPLPYAEKMGKDMPMLECEWDVNIKYGSDAGQTINTMGTFHGVRSGF